MCGIIGVRGNSDAVHLAQLGLYSLQHRGQESAGIVAIDDAGLARAVRVMAEVDSIRALLGSGAHSLGRFRRDSTLGREIQRVRADAADVWRLVSDSTGTIGRFRGDSAITHAIHRDMLALDSLMADLKKHPFRYIAF